jgi:alginate O-acetyltransferase complex protein AlgI
MLFSSQAFLVGFLPVALLAYYAAAASKPLRQIVVIIASLIFYGFWDWRFVPALFALTLLNWLFVQAFGRDGRRLWLDLGILLNLGMLGLFKYADFIATNMDALLGMRHAPFGLILPLGISFFVFQKITYLIDLKRGDRHIYGFLDFFMFVLFFPQLIAGPLVRHNEIIHQFALPPRRPEMWENLSRGAILFAIGFAKKVGIADVLGHIVDPLFLAAANGPLTLQASWAAAAAYSLQIYFDFSGYSDMAIGMGLMFGLRLPDNFNVPYRAVSIRDFWRRWHMTLSRILRDYLYIPLGGNRLGPWRQAANVIVTMLIGGLWHGANWTFVAWGGLHGAALALNSAWDRQGRRMPPLLGWLLTLLFVMFAWMLFRAPTFAIAASVMSSMIGLHGLGWPKLDNGMLILVGAVIALIGPSSQDVATRMLRPAPWLALGAGAAMVYFLLLAGGPLQREFIYFQF